MARTVLAGRVRISAASYFAYLDCDTEQPLTAGMSADDAANYLEAATLYYYPNPTDSTHYTTSPRYFYDFGTGAIITR